MDINSIRDQVSNLTLYDLKAGVRKVQNAVMNYTEMEAKVREATNNEPWGASSTLMQEIANGTHSYQLLNEIMPMIYKRFTEKAAEEWRQIYKSLQLLEFLVKNGSERVIDDARSHLSLLKMLRQFHYIDQNGKDQGINVRNRSKELAELLSDVERIRSERKKARSNRNKFGGVEGGAMSGGLGGGSRYGGFGSEEAGYGGYSGGVYGDGGGFGGTDPTFRDTSSRPDRFEEYDEYDEGGSSAAARRKPESASQPPKATQPAKAKAPDVDFLSFDDEVPPKTPPKDFSSSGKSGLISADNGLGSLPSAPAPDEDDFDDFQSATPATTVSSKPSVAPSLSGLPAPTPVAPPQGINLQNLTSMAAGSSGPSAQVPLASPPVSTPNYNISSPPAPNYNINMSSPPPQIQRPSIASQSQSQPQQPKATGYQAATPNYFTSVPQGSSSADTNSTASRPALQSAGSFTANKPTASKPTAAAGGGGGGDAFSSLWSSASTGAGIKKSTAGGSQGPNLASLQREKASQGIWGHGAASAATPVPGNPSAQPAPFGNAASGGQNRGGVGGGGGALDDLLG